ncbi:MAG: MBL fold metallo-hydrolase [Clostridia bacterium]|nr:MBL fold metallo-hydrolase [Clostridia bacterium]
MVCYTLFSGSSGNSIYLEDGKTKILIDAGGSMRQIESALNSIGRTVCDISGIFITHEHSDHTKGLPVLCKNRSIPVYCQAEVAKEMYLSLLQKGHQKEASALAGCIRTVNTGDEYAIGDILITPFKTPHDSVNSQGFIIGDRVLGIATDLGHVSEEVSLFLSGCKNIILESNHDIKMLFDGPYPPYLKERVASDHGHLNNKDSASFSAHLLEKGCERFTLFHLSSENNTPEIALKETENTLTNLCGAHRNQDYILNVAARYEVTKVL